jgi:hypothetical protein
MNDPPGGDPHYPPQFCSSCEIILDGLCDRAKALEAVSVRVRDVIERDQAASVPELRAEFERIRDEIIADVGRLNLHRRGQHSRRQRESASAD